MSVNIISLPEAVIEEAALLLHMRIDESSDLYADAAALCKEAAGIAVPVAVYAPFAPVAGPDGIEIGGVLFREPFVVKMLAEQSVVVPYVASCGKEIDAWSRSFSDLVLQFTADAIKQLCLNAIRDRLFKEVGERFFDADKSISTLNPGSLGEWPITGQKPLFEILGDAPADIGVELTESMLMIPNKSVSGVIFQPDKEFHNCQLCERADCPGRRAPYQGE